MDPTVRPRTSERSSTHRRTGAASLGGGVSAAGGARDGGGAWVGRRAPRGLRTLARWVAILLVLGALTLPAGCSLVPGKTTTTGRASTTVVTGATTSTGAATTSTTAKVVTGGSVTAQALAVFEGGSGPASGGITEFTVTVTPNPGGKVAVGVLETEISGVGPQWRASAWSAPLAAVSILNLNLADYKVTYEVQGSVDGPSAGALMTAATLAAFLGDKLKPEVTMTGAINPDYTIGPVGGIPQKLEGAAEIGKTVVLIPTGQRVQEDLATGELVDVVERGKNLGIEVREVGDVFEAYKYLTGLPLPEPRVPSSTEPVLSEKARQVVFEQTKSWVRFCEEQISTYQSLPAEYKTDYEEGLIAEAGTSIDDANSYATQGLVGSAYYAAIAAARAANLAVNYTNVEERIQTVGVLTEAQTLLENSISADVETIMQEMAAVTPQNVGEAVSQLEAWGSWTVASGLAYEADAVLSDAPTDPALESDLLDAVYLAVYKYTLAATALDAASDALELGKVLQGPALTGAQYLTGLADSYRLAAQANLETFKALVVPGLAEAWGMSNDQAIQQLSQEDVTYAEAEATIAHFNYLQEVLPRGPARDYAILGAALTGYTDSAVSLAQYYSYGAQMDENGVITGFDNAKALTQALDTARGRARAMISLAGRERADAALPTLYYESGGMNREGYPGQKLDALYDYWTATLFARVMAVLGGELAPLAPR
jgi:uncharacterized protein